MESIVFNMAGLIIAGVDITTLFYTNLSQEITPPKNPRLNALISFFNIGTGSNSPMTPI